MTGASIINEMRVRLGDVDGILDAADIDYSDSYLFEYIKASNNVLTSSEIITSTYVASGTTFSPEPSTLDGLLLASHATYTLLKSDTAKKVKDGSLGIVFKSGQDQISTVEASRGIQNIAQEYYKEYRYLVMAKFVGDSNGIQRLQ